MYLMHQCVCVWQGTVCLHACTSLFCWLCCHSSAPANELCCWLVVVLLALTQRMRAHVNRHCGWRACLCGRMAFSRCVQCLCVYNNVCIHV
jgi:hypothetical protein